MAKVLLVEDSSTQAVEMTMLLEASDHVVVHAVNGRLGLESLQRDQIDVVVTDLEMPEINGLQLVETMRSSYPHVPSILVTGHGSEDLAAEALRRGAAGYVPKTRLQDLLNDTIIDVLGISRTDASYSRLISTLQKNVFVFDLPNDPDLIQPLVGLLMQVCSGMELLPSIDMVRLGVAIEHAVVNAMCHGNLELPRDQCPSHHDMIRGGMVSDAMRQRMDASPYRDRVVHVEAIATHQAIRIEIADQGAGFDTSTVPQAGHVDAADAVGRNGRLVDDSRRGLVLMASFVDQLFTNETGSKITLIKRCPT